MTLKKPQCLTEQGYIDFIKLQVQYEKVVEQNRALQAELREKTAECEELKKEYEDILDSRQREWEEEYERYKQALDEIENRIKKYQCENCDAEVSECAWCDMKEYLKTEEISK